MLEARGFFDYFIVEIVDFDVTSSFDFVRNGTTSFSGTI
jgi:hypothetical protein